jgi:type VI secretion system secreted protein Hcp
MKLTKRISKLAMVMVRVARMAAAEESITVKMEQGKYGCSTSAGSNVLPVSTWSFGTTSPDTTPGVRTTGPANITNLILTRPLDDCSVALFATSVSGGLIPQLTLTQTEPSGKQPLLTVLLEDVRVASYQVGGSSTAPVPGETVSLSFSKITVTYTVLTPYGTAGGKSTFSWDFTRQMP